METVKTSIEMPLYQQIYNILYDQINRGEFKAGDKIPSEDNLCNIYKVSRVTVRSAISRLVDDKILVKRRGKGTYVASPVFVESAFAQGSFTQSCLKTGITPSTEIISRNIQEADNELERLLELPKGRQVICINRLRLANGVAAIFEADYFSDEHAFMLDADVEKTPMLKLIHDNGCTFDKYKYIDTFEVRFATKEQAAWLKCSIGTPLLCVCQIVFGNPNKVIYYNEQYIRSDVYKYVSGNWAVLE